MTAAITELCATLLGVLEGEALKAYQDSGGVWTIGFGHTAGVTAGMTCTHEEAAARRRRMPAISISGGGGGHFGS